MGHPVCVSCMSLIRATARFAFGYLCMCVANVHLRYIHSQEYIINTAVQFLNFPKSLVKFWINSIIKDNYDVIKRNESELTSIDF